jgi:CheY-like chemotaxis protein
VSVEADGGVPFLRRVAHSQGDAANQAEYLRVLLEQSQAGSRKPRERQPLVLIVEDDAENLLAYEETLKMDGFRTASAASLGQARRLLREVKPSAILLDHVLPDGDGTTFVRELRGSPDEGLVPVLLVTALDPATICSGCAGGPDAMLGKPCRPDTLTALLKLLVQRSGGTRRRGGARAATPPLARARCPLCGTTGALVDGAGLFHCQQCGKEGLLDPGVSVDRST